MIGRSLLAGIFLALTCFGGLSTYAYEDGKAKNLRVDGMFQEVEGTVVIKNLKTDQVYAYNYDRAKERFTPESTFKIANALIGLEENAVADEYEVKRWDGTVRAFEVWNRDHTLASAMRHSAIWYYQELARDIGEERMAYHLGEIDYGNRDISGGIDTFWLDSSLRISAEEQIAFIERLVEEDLHFQEQTMKTVKRMMIDREEDEYVLHGKTGTRLSDLGLGWYVGYVETEKALWAFATNVDGSGTTAKGITIQILETMNIIDDSEERGA